jgi:hypothetical protein
MPIPVPAYYIALYVIVLWREFNCVKIPQSEANKSANSWGNLRAKGGVVLPSVYTYPCSCADQIQSFNHSTRLRCLFLLFMYLYVPFFLLIILCFSALPSVRRAGERISGHRRRSTGT